MSRLCKSDPAELVQRPPQLALQVGTQFLARQERLTLRLVARPAQPQDLGAVHSATPVEAPDGIRLAPPFHRLGPLLGDVVLRETLQCAHELAVHDAGRERIEVTGDRRHPGLVEERQTLLDIAVEDAQPCLGHLSDGACGRVTLRAHFDRRGAPTAERRGGLPSASARRCGRPQTTRAPVSHPDPREDAPLVPTNHAPVP